MAPMKDPREFWGDKASIVDSISTDRVFKQKWTLPDVKDKDENNVFRAVLEAILKVGYSSILEGYIDLDSEWANNAELKDYRALKYDKSTLFKEFPKPFGGRKAFYAKLQIDEMDIDIRNDKGEIVYIDKEKTVPKKEKQTRITKPMKSGGLLQMQVCIFHNAKLGWKEEWGQPEPEKIIDAKTGAFINKPVDDPNFKEVFRFKQISSFISDDLMNKIEGFTKEFIGKDPTIPQEFFVFVIGTEPFERESKKDNKTYKNFNMNAEEVI